MIILKCKFLCLLLLHLGPPAPAPAALPPVLPPGVSKRVPEGDAPMAGHPLVDTSEVLCLPQIEPPLVPPEVLVRPLNTFVICPVQSFPCPGKILLHMRAHDMNLQLFLILLFIERSDKK